MTTPTSPPQNYWPTVQQVADHIQSRTRDKYGNLIRTFNTNTTPDESDVTRLIPLAASRVADVIGDQVPDAVRDDASDLVAVRTAMMIELSFFSEQVESGRSPYPYLLEEYDKELERVLEAVQSAGDDGIIGPAQGNRTSYYFPPPSTKITINGIW